MARGRRHVQQARQNRHQFHPHHHHHDQDCATCCCCCRSRSVAVVVLYESCRRLDWFVGNGTGWKQQPPRRETEYPNDPVFLNTERIMMIGSCGTKPMDNQDCVMTVNDDERKIVGDVDPRGIHQGIQILKL